MNTKGLSFGITKPNSHPKQDKIVLTLLNILSIVFYWTTYFKDVLTKNYEY